MSLHDGDVAQLAREAVDQVDPDLEIRIDPLAANDPYRFGPQAWTVIAGGRTSYVTASMTPDEARDKLIEDLAT